MIDVLLERLAENSEKTALIWRDEPYTCGWLAREVERRGPELSARGIGPGSVVVLQGDYGPATIAILLTLCRLKCITAPLLPSTLKRSPKILGIVDPQIVMTVDERQNEKITPFPAGVAHPLIATLRRDGQAGLVLFTSGSTGEPKGVVHNFTRLLRKFTTPRPALRTLNFLLFDHWGGLNTLLHALYNISPIVLPERRTPEYICELIERHRIELLPASPTFLNLLLLSKAYKGRDLSALRVISYGSEPMLGATLAGLRATFPGVELRQTYGLIELGVLRAKSEASDSLWVKLGGEGYDLRVVDGLLQIRAESAMLGYLNAPSPFTDDGFFMTGDRVEVRGEYFRLLGRDSELINVGGQKVFPAEVEGVLLESEEVLDCVVYSEPHPVTGRIVCADVRVAGDLDERACRIRLKHACSQRLEPYKVPVKIRFVTHELHGDRLKRQRPRPKAS
jgi:long-chain acyl-CoA synthetase